jgi:hypothetical protein
VNPPEEEGDWLETNGNRHMLHGTCSMGRAAANTLVLDLPKVSRMHALIQVQNIGEFWLVDLGSSNGTSGVCISLFGSTTRTRSW